MRLGLAAIGRLKAGPEHDLVEDYWARARRVGPPVGVHIEPVREIPSQSRPSAETRALLEAAPDGAQLVALDEQGEDLTTRAFADRLAAWRDHGARACWVLIGGADGHDRTLTKNCSLVLAYGRATWPHRLVRAMAAEQVYRALSILAGAPYHREG
ncbi:MAG: 23S rRNA (pseudouridine(1915)-N(3))-methyltransferase RlmH [Maricaulaceae bacterium]